MTGAEEIEACKKAITQAGVDAERYRRTALDAHELTRDDAPAIVYATLSLAAETRLAGLTARLSWLECREGSK